LTKNQINKIEEMQRTVKLYTCTVGEQYIGALFNGDLTGLTADEELRVEAEHGEDLVNAEEAFGDSLVVVEYFSKTSARFWARCEYSNVFGMCIEVDVLALVEIPNTEEHPADAYFGINSI
jgi:hypothetical protein